MKPEALAYLASLGLANLTGTQPDVMPLAEGEGKRFRHDDWTALAKRFAQGPRVDYATFERVRRVLEAYLDRLSDVRVDELRDVDERIALYLNAYNALVVYQVILHYPVTSLKDIPTAFTRPFPVGRENLSLHQILHAKLRRFGDPRIHAAIVPAAVSSPDLHGYSGAALQSELDEQMRRLLADEQRGLRVDRPTHTVMLSRMFRWFAADFGRAPRPATPAAVLAGWLRPDTALKSLQPYLPSSAIELLEDPDVRLAFLPYDWSLNRV